MEGVSATGAPVPAIVQGDLKVRSTDLPCVNCHRRSGWGTAEGTVVVPPVIGTVLFQPLTQGAPQLGQPRTTGPGTRPAYTDADLMRAVRDGVDPAGRTLSPTMPRYEVSDADAAALAAHLRALAARTPAGVTDADIHLATIVTPGVSDAKRASMLDVLRTYVRSRNGGSRYEARRRERGPWDMKEHYSTYRNWVLHEWELHGPPAEWTAELEDLYRREPVFAFVSGLSDGEWGPIDAFAARLGIPVVLPQVPLPPDAGSSDVFYSFYFSRGLTTEAKTLAHYLAGASPARRVLQVSRCGAVGQAAARTLADDLGKGAPVRSECLEPGAVVTGARWRTLLGGGADTLILWLSSGDRPALEALAAETAALAPITDIYLSSSLLGEDALRVPVALADRVSLVHPFVAPDEFDRHAARALMWMKANGLTPAVRQVAVNALFAATMAGDALTMPRTLGSREYFIERIEHMAGRSVNPSAYPSVTFDAQRRFASAGSYVLKMPTAPGGSFRKVEAWYVPQS